MIQKIKLQFIGRVEAHAKYDESFDGIPFKRVRFSYYGSFSHSLMGYKDNTIYLHSSRKGTKINLIKQNKNVCFEVDTFYETLPSDEPCSYYMKYQSVVGYGTATILEDEKEIKEGLKIIIDRYHNKEYSIDDLDLKRVAVIRIDIDDLHGRQYGMNDE